jgi:CheY-like chemotaxis protein
MTKTRVFIVDDEAGFTRLVKLTLERSGAYEVLEENDASRAWLAARSFKPHVIFLDIVMPRMDGGEVAQQIRSDPLLAGVPIIFLTAIVSQQESQNQLGGFPFLSKPVSVAAITRCIEQHVPRQSGDEAGAGGTGERPG